MKHEAVFTKVDDAAAFAERIDNPGWKANEVRRSGRTVTWDGPATAEYEQDMIETVGYFGSPPQGPQATLNGRKAPRTY